ncbi:MAG: hypothetical protein Q7R73_04715 [bacterium]|nr:hypothetical protein [bacterium]
MSRDASHHVTATVATCIDPRFLPVQFRYWTDRYGEGKFELPSHAGGAKQFAEEKEHHYGLQNLAIALEKHHAQEIVLVTHEDCAAYGGSTTFGNNFKKELAHHTEELTKAEKRIRTAFPQVKVVKIFYTFDGPREV